MASPFDNWFGSHENPAVGFATTPGRVASPESFLDSVTKSPESSLLSRRPTISTSSSSGSRYSSLTDSSSRKSSASTTASSVSSEDNLPAALILPCEFVFSGCEIAFPSRRREDWILHSLSHFGLAGPPENTMCPICDDNDFKATSDTTANWRTRMAHVAGHFENGCTLDQIRPDFFSIKHMHNRGLLSDNDFETAMSYTERPKMETLVNPVVDIPNTFASESRSDQTVVKVYNKRAEDRERQLRRRQKNARLDNAEHTAI